VSGEERPISSQRPAGEAKAEGASAGADPATFLSGDAGDVTSPWRRLKRSLGERAYDLVDAARGTQRRVERLADEQTPLRVLVLGVVRPDSLMPAALPALRSERHEVTFSLGAIGEPDRELREETLVLGLGGGKFENLNSLLAAGPDPAGFDWLVVSDDDLALPPRFLDRFLALCERFELDLAQPAQTMKSHSAWKVTRRRPGTLVRETRFVEIGPLTAFRMTSAGTALIPFPPLRFGWGLDLHWAALAAERGWRLGVVDATPVRHETGVVAAGYSNDDAIAEASAFLADRPYLPAWKTDEVLALHR
jgi:hypothetical protein